MIKYHRKSKNEGHGKRAKRQKLKQKKVFKIYLQLILMII